MSDSLRDSVDLGFIRWEGQVHPSTGTAAPARAALATVLLVDDNPHLREIASAMLRHHGYATVMAGDGEEALRVARERRPEVIVMDIDMPRMNGVEATRLLREDPIFETTPVVMLTAHREAAYLQRAVRAGCTSYLVKPFHPRDVLNEIRRVLEP